MIVKQLERFIYTICNLQKKHYEFFYDKMQQILETDKLPFASALSNANLVFKGTNIEQHVKYMLKLLANIKTYHGCRQPSIHTTLHI